MEVLRLPGRVDREEGKFFYRGKVAKIAAETAFLNLIIPCRASGSCRLAAVAQALFYPIPYDTGKNE